MSQSSSDRKAMSGLSSRSSGGQSIDASNAPLSAAEIESLLRIARDNAMRQEVMRSPDDLGPGDVQHLQGHSLAFANPIPADGTQQAGWQNDANPNSALERVEQLAEAIRSATGTQGTSREHAVCEEISSIAVQHSGPVDSRTTGGPGLTLDDLGPIDLDISIELGRTEILIEDVLKLREGSVVALNKLAGDPVDIVANGRLVARGELLVIDGKFGVRLSEVL